MPDPTLIVELSSHPTSDDIVSLLEHLCANRQRAVQLAAERVQVVTSLELQILLAAKAQWAEDDVPFSISSPSADFINGLELLGLSLEQLDEKAVL